MTPELNTIYAGDCLEIMRTWPDSFVQCCVTSPPYWGLRDYGVNGQLGLEKSPEEYVAKMVEVFREVRRVLQDDGTLWLNLGDSYAGGGRAGKGGVQKWGGIEKSDDRKYGPPQAVPTGLKPKDLVGIPWMVAFALRSDGWWLRQDIIWSKPNPMPESVRDRCTKAHEYIFMLTKSAKYTYYADAISEPGALSSERRYALADSRQLEESDKYKDRVGRGNGAPKHADGLVFRKRDKQRGHGRRHDGFNDRWDHMEKAEQCSGMRNKRSVWEIATQPFPEAHFATYPTELVDTCLLAATKEGDTVLDPFGGSGTTGQRAKEMGRNYLLIELNPQYVELARRTRLAQYQLL